MNREAKDMNCSEFQALLPELIGSGEDLSSHPHLMNCELCRALLSDLQVIAEAARQLLPIEEPPERVWKQIESAIRNEENGSNQVSQTTSDAPAHSPSPHSCR